jgi:type VI secretion system protein ImpA
MIDVEALLAETGVAPPCGPDLEYDAAFMALGQAALGKPEQQFGNTLIPAEEPEWGVVRTQAEALFPRTKDLRVATLLARAWVRTEGYDGLKPGLQLLAGLVERYWEPVHPRLDPDDGHDPVMRINALAPLGDSAGLVRDVRDAVIVRARGQAALLVRDVEIALGKLPPKAGAEPMPQPMVEAMLAEAGVERLSHVVETFQALKTLTQLLNDVVGSDRAPDLKPLAAPVLAMSLIAQRVRTVIGGDPAVAGDAAAGDAAAEGGAPAVKPARGEITCRQDAILMLDKIIAYLEHAEPANPAPLLLKRAYRLMTMSFVDIIKDLAPESLAKIEAIAGASPTATK